VFFLEFIGLGGSFGAIRRVVMESRLGFTVLGPSLFYDTTSYFYCTNSAVHKMLLLCKHLIGYLHIWSSQILLLEYSRE
jgi:hypothetical protein